MKYTVLTPLLTLLLTITGCGSTPKVDHYVIHMNSCNKFDEQLELKLSCFDSAPAKHKYQKVDLATKKSLLAALVAPSAFIKETTTLQNLIKGKSKFELTEEQRFLAFLNSKLTGSSFNEILSNEKALVNMTCSTNDLAISLTDYLKGAEAALATACINSLRGESPDALLSLAKQKLKMAQIQQASSLTWLNKPVSPNTNKAWQFFLMRMSNEFSINLK